MKLFILIVLIVFTFGSKLTYAGPWTQAMKVKSELIELINSVKSNVSVIQSISVSNPSLAQYEIETTGCKFKVEFEYSQSDPEKKIARKIKSTIIEGEPKKCDNFFR